MQASMCTHKHAHPHVHADGAHHVKQLVTPTVELHVRIQTHPAARPDYEQLTFRCVRSAQTGHDYPKS